ncbi:MAG: hypothetical protein AAB388_01990 [Patescibacteria group bacterium]
MKIKWYTVVSAILFFIALVFIIIAFALVNTYQEKSALPALNPEADFTPQNGTTSTSTSAQEDSRDESKEVEEGIPLKTLPLTPAQANALGSVGIDIETFIITPSMILCGQQVLGPSRFDAIVDGAAPTFFEMVTLTPCLTKA